jgi:hypothetical protein
MPSSASSPFGGFGTRFKVDNARQLEWLQNPVLDERTVWPMGMVTPLADDALPCRRPRGRPVAGGDQEDDQASPCPPPPVDGIREASPAPQGDHTTVRVRVCTVVDALEGEMGDWSYAAVEQDGCLVLRCSEGDVLARMPLRSLELVDIGERRVVIVPKLEPTDLTLESLGLLVVEEEGHFWDMIFSRRATYRDVQGGTLHSARAQPIIDKMSRRVDSRRARLPPIPEVPGL